MFFAVETDSMVDTFVSKLHLVTAYVHSPIFVLAGESGRMSDDPLVLHYMCKTFKAKKTLQEANNFPISIEVVGSL